MHPLNSNCETRTPTGMADEAMDSSLASSTTRPTWPTTSAASPAVRSAAMPAPKPRSKTTKEGQGGAHRLVHLLRDRRVHRGCRRAQAHVPILVERLIDKDSDHITHGFRLWIHVMHDKFSFTQPMASLFKTARGVDVQRHRRGVNDRALREKPRR